MRKYSFILFLVLLFNPFLFAQKSTKSDTIGKTSNDIGFIFQIVSINTPISNYSDGIMEGFGIKYWLSNDIAIRGVANLYIFSSADDTNSNLYGLGLGAVVEYHFLTGKASPYGGALAGIELLSQNDELMIDYHLGGLLGVEIRTEEYLAFYAEYRLLVDFAKLGTTIDLGYQYIPAIGIIIYF